MFPASQYSLDEVCRPILGISHLPVGRQRPQVLPLHRPVALGPLQGLLPGEGRGHQLLIGGVLVGRGGGVDVGAVAAPLALGGGVLAGGDDTLVSQGTHGVGAAEGRGLQGLLRGLGCAVVVAWNKVVIC